MAASGKKTTMALKGSALVVVESPTKAKTISRYLGSGYTVKATVGHVRDLPQRELGVEIDRGFEPTYVTIRGKGKTLADLKRSAKDSSAVFLATDPDREGEAIAWHVAALLDDNRKIHRVSFHEITQDAVSEAMGTPARSTSARSRPSRRGASSIGWWDTRRARSCGSP